MKKSKKSSGEIGYVLQPIRDFAQLKPWADYLATTDPWKSLELNSEWLMQSWASPETPWMFFSAADPKSAKSGGFDNQDGLIVFSVMGSRAKLEAILKAPLNAELSDGGMIQLVGTKARQKGTGKYLLSAAERLISEKFSRAFLFVGESNITAQKFYKSLGYEEIAKAVDRHRPGHVELLMMKKLDE